MGVMTAWTPSVGLLLFSKAVLTPLTTMALMRDLSLIA